MGAGIFSDLGLQSEINKAVSDHFGIANAILNLQNYQVYLDLEGIRKQLDVDSAQAAQPRVLDLSKDVHSVETAALLLAGGDGVTIPPDTLWATVRSPDALVEINLPNQPSALPLVRHAASLPISPGEMVRIPRPGASDLFAVASTRLGAVAIYDTGTQQVVAQLERLGDTPYSLKALPSPAGTARLVVSVFGDCRLGLIEVPLDRPWDAALRARLGTCPP